MPDHFPVTYSTLSVQALVQDLLPDYGLGAIVNCRLYSVGVNDTYRIDTAANGAYFLRVYRAGLRSRSDIGYELDLLKHLHRHGVSVARPLPRRDGTYFCELVAPEGRRYTVLFIEAEGHEPSYDQDPEGMAHRYGRAVAGIHNALEDFSSPHARFGSDLDHLIDTPLRNIEPFLAHRPDDWAYLRHFAETVRRRIVGLPATALEQGACHGDLQGFHAHISPDGTLTFYDFDFCGFGYRAYDLAVFRWSARLSEQEQVWWPPYLRGYRERRPVNDLDIEAVPLFICARHIWHMGLHTGNAPDWGHGDLGDAYFDRRLGWLRALEADYLTVEGVP
jgi:Ser/Thr protein kinase RdoA (MazF antagonist)